jgi:hypothetical protein
MDQAAESKASHVTWTRRLLAFVVDIVLATLVSLVLGMIMPDWAANLLGYILIFLVIPIWRGATLGQNALRIRYTAANHLGWRIFVRNVILIGGTGYFLPFWLNLLSETGTVAESQLDRIFTFLAIFSLLTVIIIGDWIVAIFARHHHRMLYEKIAGTDTVAVPKEGKAAEVELATESAAEPSQTAAANED